MRTVVCVCPELLSRPAPSTIASETVPALSELHAVSSGSVVASSVSASVENVRFIGPPDSGLLPPV